MDRPSEADFKAAETEKRLAGDQLMRWRADNKGSLEKVKAWDDEQEQARRATLREKRFHLPHRMPADFGKPVDLVDGTRNVVVMHNMAEPDAFGLSEVLNELDERVTALEAKGGNQ